MKVIFLFISLTIVLNASAYEFAKVDSSSLQHDSTTVMHDSTKVLQKDTTAVIQHDSSSKVIPSFKKDSVVSRPEIKEASSTPVDTIFKKSGFAILGKVLDKNLFEIKYIKKGEKLERKMSTRELTSIHYANGKFELIDNTPEKSKKDWVTATSEVEWKRVKVVNDEASVAGMVEKGDVEVDYEAKKINMGNDLMERNAIAILQKKANALKAEVILITSKDIKREYGEIPSIRMTAKAYSKE